MKKYFASLFLVGALIMLLTGIIAGVLISINYISPDFMKSIIPFNYLRPIHTTSVVSWIVLAAIGGVYYYLVDDLGEIYSKKLAIFHFLVLFVTALGLFSSLITGNMEGREYLVFPQIYMVPILFAWGLFGWNYYKTLIGKVKDWPVYYWMWGTGIVFMIIHLTESNLWYFEFFRKDFIRDMTIQWKSYGSFVGSWNMLVYGTAIYIMSKIKNDDSVGRGWLSFFFYFLGLTNLMFGWAHHTYILPTAPWIRYLAYGISMTEWVIFIRMIYVWQKSLGSKPKQSFPMAYRFLMASDLWVFINLLLALLMSIPALNFFSHGTHITVAHSMGTTIGINTMILFASLSFILEKHGSPTRVKLTKMLFYAMNISLLIFWTALLLMGVKKALWLEANPDGRMGELHMDSYNYYLVFIGSGIGLLLSIGSFALEFLRRFGREVRYMIYPKSIQEEIDHLSDLDY